MIDQHWRAVVRCSVETETDVHDDQPAAPFTPNERATLHRAERDREVRRHRDVALAGGRVEPTRHVERDDTRAVGAQLRDTPDRVGHCATRRPARTGAEDAVDDDLFAARRRAIIDQRFREKYGVVDWWYGLLLRRDPVPVRLDPASEAVNLP